MEESNGRMRIAFDFVLELIRLSPRRIGYNVSFLNVIESLYRFLLFSLPHISSYFSLFRVFRVSFSLVRSCAYANRGGLFRFTKRGKRADSRNGSKIIDRPSRRKSLPAWNSERENQNHLSYSYCTRIRGIIRRGFARGLSFTSRVETRRWKHPTTVLSPSLRDASIVERSHNRHRCPS